ncbi:alpha/beta fold hydrolase [bacterium]|jgi:2-succinyl-6-hydroxy-2,4-cyclohexadiene-1-carboxylate synthase|nr:alpha/beta fold hydrolase [bacterium]
MVLNTGHSLLPTFHGDPKNPIIVLLHGWLGCTQDWETTLEHLTPDYFCICIQLPGHTYDEYEEVNEILENCLTPYFEQSVLSNPRLLTDSDHEITLSRWHHNGCAAIELKQTNDDVFDTFSDLLLDMLFPFKGREISFIGYSMGGRFLLHFMKKYPGVAHKVILESTNFGINSMQERLDRWESDIKYARALIENPSNFFDKWYSAHLWGPIKKDSEYPILIDRRHLNTPIFCAQSLLLFSVAFQTSFSPEDLGDSSSTDTSNILLIHGEGDEKYRTLFETYSDQNTRLSRYMVGQAHHNSHFSHPRVFSRAVLDFLS